MYDAGQPEIDAIAKVIRSKKLFRYLRNSQCDRFEKRWAKFVRAEYAHLTSSGTAALTAALTGLGIGPGMEVLVPAHTYMATAVAVLAVGAIPVIVDIDESLTISPDAAADAIGSRTRAIIPVHMWGVTANMDAIMKLARRKKLLVLEDACQGVGGAYEGRPLGSIGHAGAYSFNYFKNITCGEGGAFVTNDLRVYQAGKCNVDCCGFYWTGRNGDVVPFVASGSRASEIEGAMLNAQLDRLPKLIRTMRSHKKRILQATRNIGLPANPANSLDHECGTTLLYLLPTAQQAATFAAKVRGSIAGKTGRHNSNEWDPILKRQGAAQAALNPFHLAANRKCRMDYSPKRWAKSMEILNRTVMIGMNPHHDETAIKKLILTIQSAAAQVVGDSSG